MVANTQIQSDLKKAKDEIKKLSSTVLLRESRFIHEAKRRDQEIGKLKERLLKVMSEAKQQGVTQYGSMSIEIIGDLANKPDGKSRGRWQNDSEDQKRGDDLLQRAFDAYEERQEALANEVTKLQATISALTENGPQNGEGGGNSMSNSWDPTTRIPSNLILIPRIFISSLNPCKALRDKRSSRIKKHYNLYEDLKTEKAHLVQCACLVAQP
jgi:hypothetical protein